MKKMMLFGMAALAWSSASFALVEIPEKACPSTAKIEKICNIANSGSSKKAPRYDQIVICKLGMKSVLGLATEGYTVFHMEARVSAKVGGTYYNVKLMDNSEYALNVSFGVPGRPQLAELFYKQNSKISTASYLCR